MVDCIRRSRVGCGSNAAVRSRGQSVASGGLREARERAAAIFESRHPAREVKLLLRECSSADPDTQRLSADALRRLSDSEAGLALLGSHAELLANLAADCCGRDAEGEWRTRGHLMLLAARVATVAERRRVSEVLLACTRDQRIVIRANAWEGLALLAARDAELRLQIEPLLLQVLRSASPAERVRARDGLALLGAT